MFAVFAAALLSSGTHAEAAKPVCQQGELRPVQGAKRAGVRKLSQEPPARQVYTVLRTEDGCTKPVFVNNRVIGGVRR